MTTLMRSLPAILAASAASLLASQSYAQDPAPIALTDTSGTTTTLTQRSDGFDVSVSDARGVTTHYSYGSTGALQSETAPERGTLRYRYDETGRLDRLQQEDGLVTALSYDDQNRLTRQVWRQNDMDKIVTRLTHDDCDNGEGKLCRVRHNDHVTRYAYTPTGQLSAVHVRMADEDQVETLRYRYNDDGQLQTLRYPSGLVLRYRYADTGRLSDIIGRYETGDDRARFVVAKNIAYDAVGRIESYTHGNGVRTKLTRTEDGDLKRITLRHDGAVLDRSTFRWNGDGRLEAIDRLNTEQNRRFGYDGSGRLIFDARGDGTADRTTTVGYSYDAVGNRLTRTAGTKTRNYNYAPDSNRLTARGRDQMVHDARGNLREDRQGRRAFDYDPTNRMVAFHRDGELRSEYDYDMQGRRIRKRLHRPDADGVRSVRFVYDTEGRLVSETRRRDDRSAVKARDIVWLGSLPLAQIERRVRGDGTTRSADVLSLHPGHLGEPREARDASGTVVWRWDGDAFGANMGGTPAVNRDPDGDGIKTEVSLRFPGQYHDRESGLFYNHHRDYDPKLGRYIQSDPIGLLGGVNRYGYVSGDPVNFVDPAGLERCEPGEDCVEVTAPRLPQSPPPLLPEFLDEPFVVNIDGVPHIFYRGSSGDGEQNNTEDGNSDNEEKPQQKCGVRRSDDVNNMNEFMDQNLGRRGVDDEFTFIRVADSIADLPSGIAGDLYPHDFQNEIASEGHHVWNLRLPSPAGSPGGYHLHTETNGGPVYGHFDAYNPASDLENLIEHGSEVGTVPSNYVIVPAFGLGIAPIYRNPIGPTTPHEIENQAMTPTTSLDDFCKSK